MHVIKYKLTQCGHICKHCERAKDEKGEYVKFGNTDIDTSRTHLNYNLCPEKRGFKFIKERCTQVKFADRSTTNVMCSWVVTAPKNLRPEDRGKFFKGMYDFYCSRYGEENVISAYVHADEGNWHMHYAFVPVVRDKKTGELKVSAREAIDRKELKIIHPAAEKFITEKLGYTVSIMTGELSDRPDLTLEQYKTLKDIEDKLKLAENKHSAILQDINDLEGKLDELERKYGNIEALEEQTENTVEEIKANLKEKKDKVIIPKDLWEKVSDLYTDLRVARAITTRYNKKLAEAHKALEEAHEQLSKIKISASYLEGRNEELRRENLALENKLSMVSSVFRASPELELHFNQIEKELQKKAYEEELEIY